MTALSKLHDDLASLHRRADKLLGARLNPWTAMSHLGEIVDLAKCSLRVSADAIAVLKDHEARIAVLERNADALGRP